MTNIPQGVIDKLRNEAKEDIAMSFQQPHLFAVLQSTLKLERQFGAIGSDVDVLEQYHARYWLFKFNQIELL